MECPKCKVDMEEEASYDEKLDDVLIDLKCFECCREYHGKLVRVVVKENYRRT